MMNTRKDFEEAMENMNRGGEYLTRASFGNGYMYPVINWAWIGWEVATAIAAKKCDKVAEAHDALANGGDNSGHSDMRADGARECAAAVRGVA